MPTTSADPTTVVWDVGNVLLEWDPARYYDARIGAERRRALFAAVPLAAANLAVDAGAPFAATFDALARDHPAWSEEIGWWRDDWLSICAPPIERSVRLLRACAARAVPCRALTNFGDATWEMARRAYPFLDLFDAAHVSARLGAVKPDPAIYAAVERAVGAPSGSLLFVDDRAENVAAAAARGWRTHRFDGPAGWAGRLVAEGILTAAEAA